MKDIKDFLKKKRQQYSREQYKNLPQYENKSWLNIKNKKRKNILL